jgi:DNA polymerase-1
VKKVLLIDGNSFCYRAFYAIRSLSTSKGQPTNAIYGFVTMLNKIIAEHQPQYIAVTFDLKGPTFRHKKFTDYKIHRKPMPNELSLQLPIIKQIIQAYGIAIFEQQGYEADDIIATLVKALTDENVEVLILTSDKDMFQVVSKNVKVINPHKENEILDETWVRERFGVEPKKIVEIMALSGDASDNIPGVPGIGEVTAIKLIKKFGSLDEVLANLDKITSKSRAEQIKRCASQARMSRELAKLDCDVPQLTEMNPSDLLVQLKTSEADSQRLFEIFKELEFKSLIQKFAPKNKDKLDYIVVSSNKEAESHLKDIIDDSVTLFAWSDHRHPMVAKIYGITFFREKEKPLFFALRLISPEILKPILENGDIKKIGHNLKYLKVLLSNYGIDLQGIHFDTMIASYLLEPAKLKYELADLALEYLDCKIEEVLGLYTDEKAAEICCQNANMIFSLSKILQKQLKEKNLLSLFENIEIPLIEILASMEKEGVALDRNLLLHLSREFETKLKNLTRQIYEMAGQDFNINSPQQLSSILFEKLKLPIIKRTKTGSSTDTDVLQRLLSLHPIASVLLEFRELSKMKSTYIDGMLKLLHTRTGKIHTSFNQAGTATGRLSCSQPNLQNIPIRTKLGKRVRQVFIPSGKDNLLLSADYSQIELRILAHLSGDKNLISAFQKDLDIHAYTASLIFGVSVQEITTQMRDTAKTVNFGIIYAMTAYGLSRDLGSEVNQAQKFIDAYFQRYPQVKSYINRQKKQAERDGFVTTLLKRRRYIPQINSPDETARKFAQRIAINAPVQGSASDLIKAAMVEIYHSLKMQELLTKMIIQVHDELVFTVPEKELEEAKSLIKHKMENVIKLKVPIIVSIRIGKNWLEMK